MLFTRRDDAIVSVINFETRRNNSTVPGHTPPPPIPKATVENVIGCCKSSFWKAIAILNSAPPKTEQWAFDPSSR